MSKFRQMLAIGITTAVLLTSLPPVARAISPGGGSFPFGGELRGSTKITGRIVCTACTLDDVRAAQPELPRLYQLNHQKGQLVITVQSVSEPARWDSIVGMSKHLWVRSPAELFQQLSAEENLFKEVTILGLLRNNSTFDMGEVRFVSPTVSE